MCGYDVGGACGVFIMCLIKFVIITIFVHLLFLELFI